MPARNLRVIDDDVVVRRAADRSVRLLALREVELTDDGLVLLGRGGGGRRGCGLHGDGDAERLRDLQKHPDRNRHRAERDDHARVGRHRALRRDACIADRHAGGRSEIGDGHPVARENGVLLGDGRMLNDEARGGRIAADDQLGRRLMLAARHEHEPDGRVRGRHLNLADGKWRHQIEWDGLPGADGAPSRDRRTLPVVGEHELPATLMNDASVMRRHTGRRQHDVAIGSTSDENGLLSESGDHARIEVNTLSRGCRAGKWKGRLCGG